MKRVMATVVLAASLAMVGCSKAPTSAYRATSIPATAKATTPVAANGTYTVAPLPDAAGAGTGATKLAAAATGALNLKLGSLKATGLLGVEIALSGGGLSSPVVQQLTAAQLGRSNTLAFEHLPAGNLTLNFTAYGPGEAVLGTAQQALTVKASGETELALGMALANGTFSVGPGVGAAAPSDVASMPAQVDDATGTTSALPPTGAAGGLKVEIVNKEVVRKYLILKKLAVTVRVTNPGAAPLSGLVTVRFHKVKGIFTKTDAVVETLTEAVANLPAGRSTELTLQSTVSAEDAEVEVHTTTASNSADTRETAFE